MNARRELEMAASCLVRGMARDTALGLALVASWLDPLRFCQTNYVEDLYGNEEDPETLMRFVVNVARDCSPRLYAEMVQGLRAGWTFNQFEDAFCDALKRLYPHLVSFELYDMIYGVPLDFCGLEPTSPEFAPHHPKLASVLDRFFGVRPLPRPSYVPGETRMEILEQDLDAASKIAEPVIRSLIAEDRQPYADPLARIDLGALVSGGTPGGEEGQVARSTVSAGGTSTPHPTATQTPVPSDGNIPADGVWLGLIGIAIIATLVVVVLLIAARMRRKGAHG